IAPAYLNQLRVIDEHAFHPVPCPSLYAFLPLCSRLLFANLSLFGFFTEVYAGHMGIGPEGRVREGGLGHGVSREFSRLTFVCRSTSIWASTLDVPVPERLCILVGSRRRLKKARSLRKGQSMAIKCKSCFILLFDLSERKCFQSSTLTEVKQGCV